MKEYKQNNTALELAASNLRVLAAAMVEKAKSGHPGGAMGGSLFINLLYSEFLCFDPDDMQWINRDRFFLDPGHMSAMLYAQLSFFDLYSMEELAAFRQWDSPTPGHPELDVARGIENTSGPLGQGHAFALGAAIAERFLRQRFGAWMSHYTYAYISDGGIQEEISQGVGRLAGHLGLGKLIMFYDSNDIQLSSATADVTSEDTAAKYRAWNWQVIEVDGNNLEQMRSALYAAQQEEKRPSLIVGKTVIGLGSVDAQGQRFEGKHSLHGQPLSKGGANYEATIKNLGGDPENPFAIFEEVAQHYKKVSENLKQRVKLAREEESQWRQQQPQKAAQWDNFWAKDTSALNFDELSSKEDTATRASSGEVLAYLADTLPNLLVASADLCDSDKTDAFLKKSSILKKDDFSGSFLQAGVSELSMAAVTSGLALHGGIIPICATFFVFSDYMKPVIRTAALMQLPVKYLWTHDAFRVGEDGPTHQPVEHEAQLRLLEKLQNHNGHNSMLVLRPADNYETLACWNLALKNNQSPSGLILSRQNIKTLPAVGQERRQAAKDAAYGAYIVSDDAEAQVVLLASGSEVSTLVAGAQLLRQHKNIALRIVSVPSEGLFRSQELSYQQQILPPNLPRFGLTAGLAVTLESLCGEQGSVYGLKSFGYSAPAQVLDEKFGYTAENVYEQVVKLLNV